MPLFLFRIIFVAALFALNSACNSIPRSQSEMLRPAANEANKSVHDSQPLQPADSKAIAKKATKRLQATKARRSVQKKPRQQVPLSTKTVTGGKALVISSIELNAYKLEIQWSLLNHPQLAAFKLYRLQQGVDDGFQLRARLARSQQRYLDKVAGQGASMSYQISAVDEQGKELARSAARSSGSFSPKRLMRARLELSLKHDGRYPELQWRAYQGDDLRGYLVFRATQNSEHWQTVSALLPVTRFVDSSARSGSKYRYRIRLLLTRGRYSDFSDTVDW